MVFGANHSKGAGYLSVHFLEEDLNEALRRHETIFDLKFKQTQKLVKNMATIPGREWAFIQLYSALNDTESTGGANWMGISQDGDPINQTMSTLAGEITTGGLGRAQGTVGHLANTNVAIVDHLFSAAGVNFNNPGIRKGGLTYQAAPGGTFIHLGKINPIVPVLDTQSIKVTGTVNINLPV